MLTYEEILASIAMWEKIIAVYEGMEKKEFIRASYYKDGSYCALGALIPDEVKEYEFQARPIRVAFDLLRALSSRYGLTAFQAGQLQSINDNGEKWDFYWMYRNRYVRVLAFCKNQLAAAKVSQQSHSGYLTDPNRPR